jgi:hypothetical protein
MKHPQGRPYGTGVDPPSRLSLLLPEALDLANGVLVQRVVPDGQAANPGENSAHISAPKSTIIEKEARITPGRLR